MNSSQQHPRFTSWLDKDAGKYEVLGPSGHITHYAGKSEAESIARYLNEQATMTGYDLTKMDKLARAMEALIDGDMDKDTARAWLEWSRADDSPKVLAAPYANHKAITY